MYKGIIYVLAAGVLVSCGGDEESADVDANDSGESSVVENNAPIEGNSDASSGQVIMPSDSKIEGMELTTIEYYDLKHDFGNVFYPSDNKFTFKFKNTGSVPLVVDKATASCGCTIPNKPEEPILPGAIGELDVIFRPKSGQVGQDVTKKITVVANTNPKETYLEISAKVMEAM